MIGNNRLHGFRLVTGGGQFADHGQRRGMSILDKLAPGAVGVAGQAAALVCQNIVEIKAHGRQHRLAQRRHGTIGKAGKLGDKFYKPLTLRRGA